jgi:phage tail sheath protein FI
MPPYHHGITTTEISTGARPLRTISPSVIGIVATSTDANDAYFPPDDLTLVTDIDAAIAEAGTTGTLALALTAISDQCKPIVIVSRFADGVDAAATEANAIGALVNGRYTGIKGFEAAKSKYGFAPKILAAPGYENAGVIGQLASTAAAINGFAYAQMPSATKEDAKTLRDTFGARELMAVWPDGTSGGNSLLTAAYAVGMRAQIDANIGWHKTLSNVPINGMTGLSHDVTWDLLNPNTDAGFLNAADITTIINEKGLRFWGDRTCSADPLFAFENYVRTGQVIRDTIAENHLWAVSKGITKTSARDIVEGVNRKLREWTALGYILGGECWIQKDVNNQAVLQAGKLVIDYDYTPIPPLENLEFRQRITDKYIADLVSAIAA